VYDLSLGINLMQLSKLRHAELIREAQEDRLLRQARQGRSVWAALSRIWSRGAGRAAVQPECPEPATA
jgi:hypothetical protein